MTWGYSVVSIDEFAGETHEKSNDDSGWGDGIGFIAGCGYGAGSGRGCGTVVGSGYGGSGDGYSDGYETCSCFGSGRGSCKGCRWGTST